VPVRPEIVRRKLVDVESAVSRRQAWLPITVERLEGDLMLQWAVERGLHIAAEALFDAGAHILADEFREPPDEYRDIARRLAAHGVISAATATPWRARQDSAMSSCTTTPPSVLVNRSSS
jgi:uncharacterized protein YutE (UPF0331/DUF86 family)